MKVDERVQLVASLAAIRDKPAPVDSPTDRWPDIAIADGYAVQQALEALWSRQQPEPAGYKIFLSLETLQAQFGTNEPAYARLYSEMVLQDGARVREQDLVYGRVEAEVAFRLGRDLVGPDCGAEEVLAATEYVSPAIELPSGRMAWRDNVPNMLADNGGAARIVVGTARVQPRALDLATMSVTMTSEGRQIAVGSTRNVLGSPVTAMVWLVRKLHEHGRFLRAGELVMTGTCTPVMPVSAGQTVAVHFEGLGSTAVTLT